MVVTFLSESGWARGGLRACHRGVLGGCVAIACRRRDALIWRPSGVVGDSGHRCCGWVAAAPGTHAPNSRGAA